MRDLKLVLLPCLVLLAVTLPHLEQGDFRRDTGRYAAVGLYMWSGGSPLAPHLHPEVPYFNKPPLAVAIHGLFLKACGPHLPAARVPSILAALGVVVLTVLSARQLGTRAEAIVSGLVLALTYDFFRRTREISLDQWQLFFVMLAVYAVAVALRRQTRMGWVLAGIPLGLALLCKPMNALAMIPLFGLWAVLARQTRVLPLLFFATLPIALVVAVPWHAYMYFTFGDAFVQKYFGREVVERARGRASDPFYFYALRMAIYYWPWLPALIYGLNRFAKDWSRRREKANRSSHASTKPPHIGSDSGNGRPPHRRLIVFGAVWVLYVGTCLSFFPDKKVNYALPLLPMMAWMTAAGLCRLPWPRLRAWYASGFRGLAPAAVGVLIVCSVLPIQFQKPPSPEWRQLLGWLGEHRIEPSRVYFGTLECNDACYFYLKTGVWMQSAARIEGSADATAIILTRADTNTAALPPGAVRLVAGDLALVSATNRVPAQLLAP
jgi:4-amino-4-deoxy-L-arabinose transferase-like glycosyltransferase